MALPFSCSEPFIPLLAQREWQILRESRRAEAERRIVDLAADAAPKKQVANT
jgi:hypothetical protein